MLHLPQPPSIPGASGPGNLRPVLPPLRLATAPYHARRILASRPPDSRRHRSRLHVPTHRASQIQQHADGNINLGVAAQSDTRLLPGLDFYDDSEIRKMRLREVYGDWLTSQRQF